MQPDAPALISRKATLSFQQLQSLSTALGEALDDAALLAPGALAIRSSKDPDVIAAIIALNRRARSVIVYPSGLGAKAKDSVFDEADVVAELIFGRNNRSGRAFSIDVRFRADRPVASSRSPLIVTTSGSTGIPKGVRLSEIGLRRFFDWSQAKFRLGPGRRVLSFAPLNFDLSLFEVWAALDAGAAAVMIAESEASDPAILGKIVEDYHPHVIEGVPLLFETLLKKPSQPYLGKIDVITTGESAPKTLRQRIAKRYPAATFHNIYGATETNNSFVFSTDAKTFGSAETLPIGTPIAETAYKIVDETQRVIDGAGTGELHTATPFCSDGYTRSDKTAEAFYDSGEVCFYKTGDIVTRTAEGEIFVVGRQDFVVKIRGVRVNIKDVESAIESHPDVSSAVVVAMTDPDSQTSYLHAIYNSEGIGQPTSLQLRKHCAERLSRSALPRSFTRYDQPLPRTHSGKKDRQALSALIRAQGE